MVLGGIGPIRTSAKVCEYTVFLSAVMLGSVGAQDSPVTPDLDGVAGEGDLDLAASIAVADAVVGNGR